MRLRPDPDQSSEHEALNGPCLTPIRGNRQSDGHLLVPSYLKSTELISPSNLLSDLINRLRGETSAFLIEQRRSEDRLDVATEMIFRQS